MSNAAPVLIGDLLISASIKPDRFVVPVLTEDVLQYLSNDSEFHPIRLDQKTYILKANVCIAFSGLVFYIKQFLEDITIFCRSHENVNAEIINDFLTQNQNNAWQHFAFVILVVDKEGDHYSVGRFLHGDWSVVESEIFGEVFTSGSGSIDFLKEIKQDAKFLTQFKLEEINYTLQAYIIMISKLLAGERLTLDTVRRHWGAGFEMIYFDKDHFTKLDNITYIVNQGMFNNNGEIGQVPVPGIILHYKYHGEVLVITVIRPHQGNTTASETEYIISCNDFGIMQFVVTPMNYHGSEDFEHFAQNPSFSNTRIAMGYIIETPKGHYLPASFNTGPEIQINYNHPNNVTITMVKGINDKLTSEANSVFPNLK